jgi:hypothetical protein
MLDKRLYREVSDLLDLSVADDKIVRILMVRGFTTEQIKRAIKDVRDKSDIVQKEKKPSAPIEETIETAPTKRFAGISKMFGKETEASVLAEEAAKMAKEDAKLVQEEKQMRHTMKNLQAPVLPVEVQDVLKLMDKLLHKLPDGDVAKFSKSRDFAKYKAVMQRYL